MTSTATSASDRRRAVDPRLLVASRAAHRFLRATVVLGALSAALVVLQAWLLASVIADAFVHHDTAAELQGRLLSLVIVVVLRGAVAWAAEVGAHRSAAEAKSDVRMAVATHLADVGSGDGRQQNPGVLAHLATTGIDGLDAYFARYLPQLVLAVIVPVAVVGVVVFESWLSGLLIALTVPLIPVFMILVGHTTASRTRRRAAALDRLAGHFLDVVAGLPTLRIFRRSKLQASTIRTVTDEYRVTTMSTLRLAFLSSLVLELLATLSVALVAVAVGLRLLSGDLSLDVAFFVLILAPEAYAPLRNLGASHHAIADGVEAMGRLFDLIDERAASPASGIHHPSLATEDLEVRNLSVVYPGRPIPAVRGLSFRVAPGERVAITGPSGSGKSTVLAALLGLVSPSEGAIEVGGVPFSECSMSALRSQLAWVPQRPHLFAGSLADNVRVADPTASTEALDAALHNARLDTVVARLPDGVETSLGANGARLSVGERQRVALARAFLRDAPLLLLDEPTANLDGETEREILSTVRQLTQGRTVLIVAHRAELLELAHRAIDLAELRDRA